jgi:flagellar basal-body rod protein FlgB
MDPSRIALFDLADKRLAWADQRQALLAQNIANADTPGWRPRDLAPFDAMLKGTGVTLAQTDPKHLAGSSATAAGIVELSGERAPDGNGVALDKELSKVADTDATHQLVTGLYRKYLAFFQTALGR